MANRVITIPRPWRIILPITAFGLAMFIALGVSARIGLRLVEQNVPLQDASMVIKVELGHFHLALLKRLYADSSADVSGVWEHLDDAEWHARAMLEGGKDEEAEYVPIEDPELKRELALVLEEIKELRALAERLLKHGTAGASGREAERRLNTVVGHVLMQADRMEGALHSAMREDFLEYEVMTAGLLLSCILFTAVVSMLLYRHGKRRADDISALTEAHERLTASEREVTEALGRIVESETKFRSLVEKSLVGVYIIKDWRFRYVNPRVAEFLGYTAEELMAFGNILDIVHPDDRGLVERKVIARLTGEVESVHYQSRWLRKDGKAVDIEVIGTRTDYEGLPAIIGTLLDVTEQKKTAEALARSRDFYLTLFDEFPAMIWRSGVDAKCNYFNKAWLGFTGRPVERELGDGWAEGVHKDDLDRCVNTYLDAFKARRPFSMEYRLRRYDGEYRWITDSGGPYNDLDGNFAGYIGSCYDITDRRLADELLKQSEERYRNLVELTSDIIYISDARGNQVFMNDAAYKMLEVGPEEVIGQLWSKWIHPDDREKSQRKFMEMVSQGVNVFNFENRYVSKGGRVIHVLHNVRVLRDEKGDIAGTQGIARDITARKLAEEKLRLLSAAIEAAPDVVQVVGLDGRIIYTNKASENIYGYAPAEFLGRHVSELNVDTDLAGRKILPSIVRSGQWAGELMVRHKDGHAFPIWLTASMVKDDEGAPVAMVGVVRDITERRRAEEELRRFKFILDGAGEEFFLMAPSGDILYANEAAATSLGYTVDELSKMRVPDVDPAYDEDRWREHVADLKSRDVPPFETAHKTKTGHIVPKEIKAVFLALGRNEYVCAFSRDITERKHLDRQKTDFFAMVTHDLKSPLTAILGYSELILTSRAETLDPETLSMVTGIHKSGGKLLKMVEDYLTLSRMEAGKLTLSAFPEQTRSVLSEVAEEYAAIAAGRGLSFSTELPEGLPLILVDKKLVQRAVSNLLQNAVVYTPRGGSVALKVERLTERERDFVSISVSDTGPGISLEERDRVFEKYYRSPRTAGIRGSGLGLAIVKAVAEAHGGKVELESAEDKGSVFRLILPVRG